ncbi:MAG: hypothetical protein ACOYLO_10245 [Ferruginibacter sp.]
MAVFYIFCNKPGYRLLPLVKDQTAATTYCGKSVFIDYLKLANSMKAIEANGQGLLQGWNSLLVLPETAAQLKI